MHTSTVDINRSFYEQAYNLRAKSVITYWRRRLSFDQQYKCNINWQLISAWLSEGNTVRRVLEIGFGFGLTLSKFPRDALLVGTDISWNAARLLRQTSIDQGRQVLFCVNDSNEALPFQAWFDVIICSHVLEHVPNDIGVLNEFRRLIAPRGALLLNVPINELVADPKHARHYDEEILRQQVSLAGFRIIQQVVADRWSVFFSQRQGQKNLMLKAMRGICALMPYHLVEQIGAVGLRHLPCQQLALLAVPV